MGIAPRDTSQHWEFLLEALVTELHTCWTMVKMFFFPGGVCSCTPHRFPVAGEKGHGSLWAFMEVMWRSSAQGLCMGSAAVSWAGSLTSSPALVQELGDASTMANEATDMGE